MAHFFEAAVAGVCATLILCVNQSAVSLGWFCGMARSCLMTRSGVGRSHLSNVVWTSWPIVVSAGSGIWAERSSCPARVTSCAHLASNCAWVAVAVYV